MLTVTIIVAVSAFICAVASAAGKLPVWVPVVLLSIGLLLLVLPLK